VIAPPPLRLVGKDGSGGNEPKAEARDLDWSILMARAQDGDQAAYHRLLQEVTPYLRRSGGAPNLRQRILFCDHAG
jgi:hypothetical protein